MWCLLPEIPTTSRWNSCMANVQSNLVRELVTGVGCASFKLCEFILYLLTAVLMSLTTMMIITRWHPAHCWEVNWGDNHFTLAASPTIGATSTRNLRPQIQIYTFPFVLFTCILYINAPLEVHPLSLIAETITLLSTLHYQWVERPDFRNLIAIKSELFRVFCSSGVPSSLYII